VRCIAFDRLDKVGNEISPTAQLNVNAAPAFRHVIFVADKRVIHIDQIARDNNYEAKHRIPERHLRDSPAEPITPLSQHSIRFASGVFLPYDAQTGIKN
jgi:hypothetical protein